MLNDQARRLPVKIWDVRSFQEDCDAEFFLNKLQAETKNLKLENMSTCEKCVVLVVSYTE